MKIKHKHIKAIDYILIVGTLISLFGIFYQYYYTEGKGQPIALSPEDGFETTRSVLFEFENAETILIDDNIEFTSPEKFEVKNNFVINLKPGKYYWKLAGNGESEIKKSLSQHFGLLDAQDARLEKKHLDIRQLSVESEVSLEVRESEVEKGKYNVVNVGNEELEVDVFEFGKLKENIILDIYESREVSGNKFIGGQNG